MSLLDSFRAPVATEFEQFTQLFSQQFSHPNPLLHKALQHLSHRTGKQMRPALVLLCAKMAGHIDQRVLHGAVALEILHTATLVHDDVVDESDSRRGQASVNALLNNKVAVLVGDYMLSLAINHAAKTESTEVVTEVANLGQTLSDGEIFQLDNTRAVDFSEKAYYEIIRKKTATLFSACARIGSILGGADVDRVEQMRQFGQLTGICFQLRDDILDFDTHAQTGKPAGNDMQEGKLTLPVLHALHQANDPAMEALAISVRRGEASAEQIAQLVAFTHQYKGIDYAEWSVDEFRYMATGLIPQDCPPDISQALHDYVDCVAQRRK